MEEEEVTFCRKGLADFLHLGTATVAHKMSQKPEDLPPAVVLLGEGTRVKRIWLKSTVVAWLKAKQLGSSVSTAPSPTGARAAVLSKRGRPQKNAAEAHGEVI